MTDLSWGWTADEINHLSQKGERVGAVLGLIAEPDRENRGGPPIIIEGGALFVRFTAFDLALGPELPEKQMLGAEVFDVMGDVMTTYAVSLDDLFRGIDLDRPRS